ncbi:uncharacterized protein MONOS_9637 [Monocercomonoides exilis]|uniref:uncharacterized protein n=1 Tax=Monocercomonoides exilis TaxID=2049356 RepID=UPI00355ACBF1|nr:hypothetical protein MONOS_9637 [Monocercomonoides exilis]|eukprot:MONOS_9637.1-p1 / transcript=MONOS_9637.1 / gene=MONOS_9637 / organism=Monocercomonoides_exilis_PA203 / gene_product=unspecified product / transcript_product=unspecified product / location=Mono_scaffold00404:47628-49011(-) / protein_length=420 / sequence_SO=supercontig / SO=protein_coding / is_pseudo=false
MTNTPAKADVTVIDALQDAMKTDVKKDSISVENQAKTEQTHLPQQKPKRVPPIAPPSIPDELFIPQTRTSRSQSMMVRPGQGGFMYGSAFHVPGQRDGIQVPFDPKAEFLRATSSAAANLPRSSLQMEESSTILHPSKFRQIVPIDLKGASGYDSRGRQRRNTISGTQRVPSGYREVLMAKVLEDKKQKEKQLAKAKGEQSTDQKSEEEKKNEQSSLPRLVPSLLSGGDSPHPTAPSVKRGRASGNKGDKKKAAEGGKNEGESAEANKEGQEGKEKKEGDATSESGSSAADEDSEGEGDSEPEEEVPMPAPSPSITSTENIKIFGLSFEGGLIDFVDHPPNPDDEVLDDELNAAPTSSSTASSSSSTSSEQSSSCTPSSSDSSDSSDTSEQPVLPSQSPPPISAEPAADKTSAASDSQS